MKFTPIIEWPSTIETTCKFVNMLMINQFCIILHAQFYYCLVWHSRTTICAEYLPLWKLTVTTFTRAHDLSPIVQLRWTVCKTSRDIFAEYAREIRSGLEQREWRLTTIAFKTATSTLCNNICRTRTEGRIAVSRGTRREGDINIRLRGFTTPFAWLPGLERDFVKRNVSLASRLTAKRIYTRIRHAKATSWTARGFTTI